jgi:hypothetical protein
VPFRDDREAQRARIQALENEVAELKEERDRALAERDESDDEDDEKLIDEAAEERSKELEKARLADDAERRRRRSFGAAERWSVAWNLRRGLHTFLGIAGGIGLLGVCAFGSVLLKPGPIIPGERLAMELLALACSVFTLGGTAWLAKSVLRIRGLRSKLPFELDPGGWASLVDKEHFWIAEMWWHVALSVEGGGRDEGRAALERLCERANRTFYGADDPKSDERIRWQRKGKKVRGSANRNTALVLLEFCAEELARVRGVKRVHLTVGENPVHVSRPSSD